MNTVVTSREAILAQGRRLVQQEGWQALNIRSVAAACSISVGSVYHYFGSKAELMGEIVACVWRDVFHLPEDVPETDCFGAQVALLFDRLAEGERQYPGYTLNRVETTVSNSGQRHTVVILRRAECWHGRGNVKKTKRRKRA